MEGAGTWILLTISYTTRRTRDTAKPGEIQFVSHMGSCTNFHMEDIQEGVIQTYHIGETEANGPCS